MIFQGLCVFDVVVTVMDVFYIYRLRWSEWQVYKFSYVTQETLRNIDEAKSECKTMIFPPKLFNKKITHKKTTQLNRQPEIGTYVMTNIHI